MKKGIIKFLLFILIFQNAIADEGMWIPMLLGKYNIKDMQEKGFKLSAEDIYSINKASMKDAVMLFGRGCTAELISDKGLIITNHHCGYRAIQSHSSVEHDYLTDGFWAMNKDEELVNPNLTVTFLVEMRDVTKDVLKGYKDDMSEEQREAIVSENAQKLILKATEGTHYQGIIKPFFNGNAYYLFVNEVFRDVRLVGAPPSAIGKFGGDTDNWMWPRHTGDFSVFRIYANKDNKPAEYSPDNVPYKPKKFLPISLKGVNKDDFTMVFGYPGSTYEYMPSNGVELVTETLNPERIDIRQQKIDIIGAAMNEDPKVRIQYSAKYASISNAWKKWIGQSKGLAKIGAIGIKEEYEAKFTDWVKASKKRTKNYGTLLNDYEKLYDKIRPYSLARTYLYEAGFSIDILRMSDLYSRLLNISDSTNKETVDNIKKQVLESYRKYLKDYNLATDKAVTGAMMSILHKKLEEQFRPAILNTITSDYANDAAKFNEMLYTKSLIADSLKFFKFVENYKATERNAIIQDPLYKLNFQIDSIYSNNVNKTYYDLYYQMNRLDRLYMKAQMEHQKDKVFYPDANLTLRVAYGKVDTYYPRDGVMYLHYTTLDGIIEKDNPEIYDYKVPQKLKELHKNKDYGRYAQDGQMRVCFIASNHTTGGNSGSPVINAEGHLIGINFDRSWESTMSDIMYDPEICRNITLDIRYALFIIDKFAGAGYLVDEMQLITE